MRIVVTGGTGFIGAPLVESLSASHEVAVLTRQPKGVPHGRGVSWDGDAWQSEVAACDAVVNLAGENIGEGRWTEDKKKRIVESRTGTTRRIVEAMREGKPGKTLISASASGYYGSRGDEILTESSPTGDQFLSRVTREWEEEARRAEEFARVVIFRFGIVLAGSGGALHKLLIPFRLFAGGPVGSGEQWWSWIDRADVVNILEWGIKTESVKGVHNASSPNPVRNRDFVRLLGSVLHRPAVLPAPAFALRTALGRQKADELLLASQRILPERATREGFVFQYSTLEESLRHAIRQ